MSLKVAQDQDTSGYLRIPSHVVSGLWFLQRRATKHGVPWLLWLGQWSARKRPFFWDLPIFLQVVPSKLRYEAMLSRLKEEAAQSAEG